MYELPLLLKIVTQWSDPLHSYAILVDLNPNHHDCIVARILFSSRQINEWRSYDQMKQTEQSAEHSDGENERIEQKESQLIMNLRPVVQSWSELLSFCNASSKTQIYFFEEQMNRWIPLFIKLKSGSEVMCIQPKSPYRAVLRSARYMGQEKGYLCGFQTALFEEPYLKPELHNWVNMNLSNLTKFNLSKKQVASCVNGPLFLQQQHQ